MAEYTTLSDYYINVETNDQSWTEKFEDRTEAEDRVQDIIKQARDEYIRVSGIYQYEY